MVVTRERISSRSSAVRLPRSTCLLSDFSSPANMASAVDWLRLRSTTSWPDAAAASVMPEPMIPEPMIPTLFTDMGSYVTDQ